MARPGREAFANHQSGFDPPIEILDAGHARDRHEVALHRPRHVAELVGGVPDVRAGSLDRPGARGERRRARCADSADVERSTSRPGVGGIAAGRKTDPGRPPPVAVMRKRTTSPRGRDSARCSGHAAAAPAARQRLKRSAVVDRVRHGEIAQRHRASATLQAIVAGTPPHDRLQRGDARGTVRRPARRRR